MAWRLIKNISIQSTELDEIEDYISRSYAPVKITTPMRTGPFGIEGNYAHVDSMLLEWTRTTGLFTVNPIEPYDAVLFNFMDTVGSTYTFGKQKVDLEAGQVFGYRHATNVDVHDKSEHITIAIPDSLLSQRLSRLLDKPAGQKVEFCRNPISQEAVSSLSQLVRLLRQQQLAELAFVVSERSDSLTNFVVDSFLLQYKNNHWDQLRKPVAKVAPRHVKRALDYIHANPQLRSSPDLLADLSAVSVRSLQYSFLEYTGQTISAYQLSLKLQNAYNEVMSRDDLSLQQIARRWGFNSQSAFGQSFRRAFGITPSELRRSNPRIR